MSTTDGKLEAVRSAVEPAVRALGFSLYDVEIVGGASAPTSGGASAPTSGGASAPTSGGARAAPTLRVTVTRDGGVDLDAITEVTRAVSPVLDRTDALPGAYLLEVSSPGIERVLRRPEHFRGAVGEHVSIKVRADGATRRVHGVLVSVHDEQCVVDLDDGSRTEIAIDEVTQARTVFAWGPQPRTGKKQRGEAIA